MRFKWRKKHATGHNSVRCRSYEIFKSIFSDLRAGKRQTLNSADGKVNNISVLKAK